MAGTAVVTGATGGIGLWIALGLARHGFAVVLVGRNAARGAAALGFIKAQAPGAEVSLELADLSSLSGTHALARRVAAAHPRLALLVNNAGAFRARRARTAEGHDLVLATNHLSPFVLTQALLPALQAGAPSRIVTVGSSTSDSAALDLGNIALDRGWTMTRAYGRSKLLQMMTTFAVSERLRGTGVVAHVVHPGRVATGLVRSPGIIGLAWRLIGLASLTPEQGADTPVYAATAPDMAGQTGLYLKDRRPVPPNPHARDPALCRAAFDATAQLVSAARAPVPGAAG